MMAKKNNIRIAKANVANKENIIKKAKCVKKDNSKASKIIKTIPNSIDVSINTLDVVANNNSILASSQIQNNIKDTQLLEIANLTQNVPTFADVHALNVLSDNVEMTIYYWYKIHFLYFLNIQ